MFSYNRIAGLIKKIVSKLKSISPKDEYRIKKTTDILDKLYSLGLINNKASLFEADKIGISTFCRRRLSVLMYRNKYCETVKEAITFIEQGNVRVGTEVVTDPGFIVTRAMEDHLTWANNSKIKGRIMKYNNTLDEYDLMN
jgi:U3 small nucleolar ribonucleoprotein protein IMP3